MQNACKLVGVSNIDDINAICALYRPGPMAFIPDYARGKRDPASVQYPHPLLEQSLQETHGIIVYQEQVMECAKLIAGYTLGGADMLRRAMGKKDAEAMAKERIKFVEGAQRVNNLDQRKADEIFDLLNKFASYGFNKSHSAAYALVSYQTAYLKANYPVQFMAAVLTAELGNAEKVSHFIDEAQAMGITVLGPDVNESRANFTPVGDKIRFGLAGIKGVGEGAALKIIEEREANGPYRDFDEFLSRVDSKSANKRVLEHLAKTGAFDFGGEPRKRIFDRIDAAMAAAAAHARDRAAGQGGFFDLLAEEPKPRPTSAAERAGARGAATGHEARGDDFTAAERLAFEKELLGFYVTGHPMNTYAALSDALDTYPVETLLEQDDREQFRLCGIASNLTKKLSKKDNRPWVAFTLATKRASIALNMFADAFAAYGPNLQENLPVAVLGTVMRGEDGARVNVKECYPLDNYVTGNIRRVTWLLHPRHPETTAFMQRLRETLNQQVGDTRTSLGFLVEGRVAAVAEVSTALGWKLSGASFQQLRAHPAVAGVQIESKPLEIKETRRWARRG
jgi:DNA polymerase III subunit alpha